MCIIYCVNAKCQSVVVNHVNLIIFLCWYIKRQLGYQLFTAFFNRNENLQSIVRWHVAHDNLISYLIEIGGDIMNQFPMKIAMEETKAFWNFLPTTGKYFTFCITRFTMMSYYSANEVIFGGYHGLSRVIRVWPRCQMFWHQGAQGKQIHFLTFWLTKKTHVTALIDGDRTRVLQVPILNSTEVKRQYKQKKSNTYISHTIPRNAPWL